MHLYIYNMTYSKKSIQERLLSQEQKCRVISKLASVSVQPSSAEEPPKTAMRPGREAS